jgi:hypothetical protein
MEVHFTPELEAKLTRFAARQGRNPDELVQDVLTRYFDHEQAGQRVEKEAAGRTIFEQGLGLFGSPEDAALLDEVVSIAYEERRRPTKPLPPL